MQGIKAKLPPSVLVGPGDDAGVCLFSGGALVETVDVISPVVDDPFIFGEISAANSISDIYAMGGRPLSAMAIAGYPACDTDPAVIKLIMDGALATLARAGATLIGGHSFDNSEIKFGLSVSGTVDSSRILRATGAEDGDLLVLTKPLGAGILTTALKGGVLSEDDIADAIKWMRTLNDNASVTAMHAGASACTDVTGFGLLGHAINMLRDAALDFAIDSERIPVMQGVMEMMASGMVPQGAYRNLDYVSARTDFSTAVSEEKRLLFADPQTSGGLLIAVKESGLKTFEATDLFYAVIGKVRAGSGRLKIS